MPDSPADEHHALNPSSPYSASKSAADLLALSYHTTHGLNIRITRSTNNIGPKQHPEKLIPMAISRLMADKAIPIYGRGEQMRDWLFVKDNCAGIYLAMALPDLNGGIFNIGTGECRSNISVAHDLCCVMGKDPQKHIEFVDDRKGHDYCYSVSTKHALRTLEWSHSTRYMAALELTANWYRSNSQWLEAVADTTASNERKEKYKWNAEYSWPP
jgi:dTDP-glucose 4,6-dehydratase